MEPNAKKDPKKIFNDLLLGSGGGRLSLDGLCIIAIPPITNEKKNNQKRDQAKPSLFLAPK
jgi:hypothetical protein